MEEEWIFIVGFPWFHSFMPVSVDSKESPIILSCQVENRFVLSLTESYEPLNFFVYSPLLIKRHGVKTYSNKIHNRSVFKRPKIEKSKIRYNQGLL